MTTLRARAVRVALAVASVTSSAAWAGGPPWSEPGSVPLGELVASAAFTREDEPLYRFPRADGPRRGSVFAGARLPIFASRTGPGCETTWLMVGPMAWVCRAKVELSESAAIGANDAPPARSDGLPYRYFFVGRGGSAAYGRIEFADEAEPEMELQPGFGVALVDERLHGGQAYGRTHHGQWVPMRDLVPVRPFLFQGEEVRDTGLDLAWVLDDGAATFKKPQLGSRTRETRGRLQVVRVRGEAGKGNDAFVQIGEELWRRARDVRRPTRAEVPVEVGPGERWIDVELATQTLVAYEGSKPVFATVVSTGKGAPGTALGTPKGAFRIWVKLKSSTMDNLEDENASNVYAIEDVPHVQYFSKGVALHAAFWHRAFGRVRSHGCVNLSPLDAERLFHFTGPHLPAGWSAVLPNEFERGTVVRVR